MSDLTHNPDYQFTLGHTHRAVIFLPGLCGSSLEMGSLPKLIHGMGHTICIPKIQGYHALTGVSDYQEWLDYLDRVVDLLKVEHEEIAIVGLSMGAILGLTYVSNYPNKCLSVVALAPVIAYDGWNVPWYTPLLFLIATLGIRNWSIKESEPFGLKNSEIRRRVEKQVQQQEVTEIGSSSLSAEHLYQGLQLISEARKSLGSLSVDTLIISAIDDDITSPHSAEWIHSTIQSQIKKLVWLGNSYHIITLDNEREIVVNETIEFIQLSFAAQNSYLGYSDETKAMVIKDRLTSGL